VYQIQKNCRLVLTDEPAYNYETNFIFSFSLRKDKVFLDNIQIFEEFFLQIDEIFW